MFYPKEKSILKQLLTLFLFSTLWLTACGELEFGVETKVSSGRPEVTVVTTAVAEIPEGMVLVTVTPSAQATALAEVTATPTAVASQTPTPTATNTPTPTKEPTPTPIQLPATRAPVLPSPTPTPNWAEILIYPTVSSIVWPGESVTVEYEVRSNSAALCLAPVFTQDWTCHSAPTSGPYTLNIDSTTKTNLLLELRAFAADSEAVSSATIMLYCNEDEWFFSGPPATCPAGAPLETAAAYQRFEHGIMFWLEKGLWWEPGEMIYVLYDSPGQTFEAYPEYALPPSDAPMPEIEYDPPEGLFVPESGFGLLWRENSWIRQRLGWALIPETGFNTTAQREFTQDGAYLYLLDFEDQLIVLNFYKGTWAERSQP